MDIVVFEQLIESLEEQGYYPHFSRGGAPGKRFWVCYIGCGVDRMASNLPRPASQGDTMMDALRSAMEVGKLNA